MKQGIFLLILITVFLIFIIIVGCSDEIKLQEEINESVATEKTPESEKPIEPMKSAKIESDGVIIKILEVVQKDLLEVHISYENTNKYPVDMAQSLIKIVAGKEQIEFDLDVNLDSTDLLIEDLEAGVKQDSIVYFKPVDVETINIIMKPQFSREEFKNIIVQKGE